MRVKALFVSNVWSHWSAHTSTFMRQTHKVSEMWFSHVASYLRLLLSSLTTNGLTSDHRTLIICNPCQCETIYLPCHNTEFIPISCLSLTIPKKISLCIMCSQQKSDMQISLYKCWDFLCISSFFFPLCYVWGWVNIFSVCLTFSTSTSFFNLVPLLFDVLGPASHSLLYTLRIRSFGLKKATCTPFLSVAGPSPSSCITLV